MEQLYGKLLVRPADPLGLIGWVNFMAAGATARQVEAGIIGSPEYFFLHGGNNASFLASLYQDGLGRDPNPVGLAGWGSSLALGFSRTQVAAAVLGSPEAAQKLVLDLYLGSLRRPADPVGFPTAVSALLAGLP